MFCCFRKRLENKRRESEGKGLGLEKGQGYGGAMRTILFGMLLGLVAGLLLAPKPGTQTINRLAEKKSKLMEKLIRTLPV